MSSKRTVIFDIETYGAEEMWDRAPEEMFRLGGYSFEDGHAVLTEDLAEMREVLRSADLVCGHNIHAFDLTVIFGKDSTEPLEMALADRVWDTLTHATLVYPHPDVRFTARSGRTYYTESPKQAMRWYGLDNLCFQLGLPGKVEDLRDLAKKYGGFGEIPVDDETFREYLRGDLVASRQLARALMKRGGFTAYSRREQQDAAINAQNTRNGWRIEQAVAQERIDELDAERDRCMTYLVDNFDLPSEGKAPLRSNAGKAAVLAALESVGVSESALPRTPKGAPSFSGDGLIQAAEGRGEKAEALARNIAAIGGQRPLAASALGCVRSDGRVHPNITTLQRSGRKSTTEPGLTIWTARGAGAVEKRYFVPNNPDEVLLEADFSQADARIVAALSGDAAYARRFEPGADAHLMTAWAVWGKEEVGTDVSNPKTAAYRNLAKAAGHAYTYRVGFKKLAMMTGQTQDFARRFIEVNRSMYPGVVEWQDRATDYAKKHGFVVNHWGRKMRVERDREYTQAPALLGQSGTREIMTDGLIRLAQKDVSIITMLVGQIHDAVVLSVPRQRVDEITAALQEEMSVWWQPHDGSGQAMHFEMQVGKPALNWQEAGH